MLPYRYWQPVNSCSTLRLHFQFSVGRATSEARRDYDRPPDPRSATDQPGRNRKTEKALSEARVPLRASIRNGRSVVRQDRGHFSYMQLCAQDFVTLRPSPEDAATGDAQRSALAAESLRQGGRLRLQVRGESMLPTLWPGDVVEIARCSPDDVRPGEIVLALRDGRFFLHRFVARQTDSFLLRGDSMPAYDPQFPSEALLGRLVHRVERWQFHSEVAQGEARLVPPLRPWSWAFGKLFCHCGPARRLALKLHAHRERHGNGSWISDRAQSPVPKTQLFHADIVDPGAS